MSAVLDPEGESLLRILGGGGEGNGARDGVPRRLLSQEHFLTAVVTAASHPHQVWHVISADPYVRTLRYALSLIPRLLDLCLCLWV